MDRLGSYPSIFNVGHRGADGVFTEEVTIQEKVDGSQFSFGVDAQNDLQCRSKGATIYVADPPKLFSVAVDSARRLHAAGVLFPGLVYRGEAFLRPKHNVLRYNRAPAGGMVLFDIEGAGHNFMDYRGVAECAQRYGLEPVPTYDVKVIGGPDDLKPYLERESVLGGVQVEGVVAKNYLRFGIDKHPLMVKLVSAAFKEIHGSEWKSQNPGRRDIVETVIRAYGTQARWAKAVIHLREQGLITDTPKDIGLVLKEVQTDILKESGEAIAEELMRHLWKKDISRGVTKGLPEWYLACLAARVPTEEGIKALDAGDLVTLPELAAQVEAQHV